MEKYIALLRGINVGGHRKIKMDSLKESLTTYGFENVQTYIQSGNVIFQSDIASKTRLSDEISRLIKKDFGHEVPVVIRTPREISHLLNRFPFGDGRDTLVFFPESLIPQPKSTLNHYHQI